MSALTESSVTLHSDWLRLTQSDHHADFHIRWLRHHGDPARHPKTGEPTRCASELPDHLSVRHAAVSDGVLVVEFSDGVTARLPVGWLEQHAYARDRVAPPPMPSDVDAVSIVDRGDDRDALTAEALRRVQRDGLVVLRRAGPSNPVDETESLIAAFTGCGLTLVETHFGRIEDLRTDNTTNQHTDQLGYTDAGIQLHTDQPFLARPPRYQLLQSIRLATKGGENFLVDAKAASEQLRAENATDHGLLSTTKVTFRREQGEFQSAFSAPILDHRADGFQVRSSYFSLAPHQLPFDQLSAWYRAHDRWMRFIREPQHQFRFRLEPGDAVLYDNWRMLHAREGFEGPRWVRGVYFDP